MKMWKSTGGPEFLPPFPTTPCITLPYTALRRPSGFHRKRRNPLDAPTIDLGGVFRRGTLGEPWGILRGPWEGSGGEPSRGPSRERSRGPSRVPPPEPSRGLSQAPPRVPSRRPSQGPSRGLRQNSLSQSPKHLPLTETKATKTSNLNKN